MITAAVAMMMTTTTAVAVITTFGSRLEGYSVISIAFILLLYNCVIEHHPDK